MNEHSAEAVRAEVGSAGGRLALAAQDRRRIHETGLRHHAAGTEFLPRRLQQRGAGRDRLDSVGDCLRRAVSRRS